MAGYIARVYHTQNYKFPPSNIIINYSGNLPLLSSVFGFKMYEEFIRRAGIKVKTIYLVQAFPTHTMFISLIRDPP